MAKDKAGKGDQECEWWFQIGQLSGTPWGGHIGAKACWGRTGSRRALMDIERHQVFLLVKWEVTDSQFRASFWCWVKTDYREQGGPWADRCSYAGKRWWGLGPRGGSKGDEKCSDPGYVLKMDPKESPGRMDIHEKKKKKSWSSVNWNSRILSTKVG